MKVIGCTRRWDIRCVLVTVEVEFHKCNGPVRGICTGTELIDPRWFMGQVVEALDEVSLDWLDLDEERPPVDIFEELQEATSPALESMYLAARECLRDELGPKHLARKWDGVYGTGGNIRIRAIYRDYTNNAKAIVLRLNPHPKESNCLKHFIINPIQPCRYQFPIADFDAAIALAATFTGILLGTLQDVVVRLAGNNDVDLTRVMAATIGNEGGEKQDKLWFTYVNHLKEPIVELLKVEAKECGGKVVAKALFPHEEDLMNWVDYRYSDGGRFGRVPPTIVDPVKLVY
ncbi:hypothetical protein ETB97_012605 [Aspergillus alliaceus]|uniref:Uncharacterized protein n=1 Tax=Petromyces alliaceus TaxID=209559 RepID=A0A8H6A2W2_PETAA|nr:hypothetical protein ETB97_012605 [Aspergillus burnettii]